ncbi:MAG: hypothetical protein Q9174_003300 [Haloplaca sp. 1 TL-2023]
MSSRKYNEYLDAGSSEDEESLGHASDIAQETKGKRSTALKDRSKRQKINHETSDDFESEGELGLNLKDVSRKLPNNVSSQTDPTNSTPQTDDPLPNPSQPTAKRAGHKTTHATTPSKPGVIYLSRLPPFIRPSTVRSLLTPFGTITHLFLTPEPPSQHSSRIRSGGNKKRSYTDGWVSFQDHKSAKTCVAAINGQTMAGAMKKKGYYRDDVWNARYLRGFVWEDLMAEVRVEEREREERVRVGVRREKREREGFLRGVERGKVEETRRKKKEAREGKSRVVDGDGHGKDEVVEEAKRGFERRFRQNEVKARKQAGQPSQQPEDVSRVLAKIF